MVSVNQSMLMAAKKNREEANLGWREMQLPCKMSQMRPDCGVALRLLHLHIGATVHSS